MLPLWYYFCNMFLCVLFLDPENIEDGITHHPPLGKSHHSVLTFNVPINAISKPKSSASKFLMNKGNYEEIKLFLENTEWDAVFNGPNVEDWWKKFYEVLYKAMADNIPKGPKTCSPKRSVPATLGLLNKLRLKRSAFKTYKKYPTTANYNSYARYRNQVKWEVRKAARAKEEKIAREAKTNPKSFYYHMSKKLKTKENIPNLSKPDGSKTNSDLEKTEVLNNFFSSVFTQEDLNTVPTFDSGTNLKSLSDVYINETQMLKALTSLNISKSPGPDLIHPRLLKEAAYQLTYPLTILFNKTIESGYLPDCWKVAEVRPIFKKGTKSSPNNYRPVSLTSVLCKLYEGFIRDELYSHLLTNNLLSKEQYGFCKGRSTITQLLVTMEEWISHLDNEVPVDAIYLDLSKAFDSVPHARLLKKLEGYGIQGNLLKWLGSFLKNRTQYVSINEASSSTTTVTSGVPQGSVLGPILFIYYINDMPDAIQSSLKIFADDTKIYTPVTSTEDKNKLQNSLNELTDWSDKWLLKFNSDKCKTMHIGKSNPKHTYHMNGHQLQSTDLEKDLGVHVDTDLSFNSHITKTVSKARSISGLLIRTLTYKSKTIMVPLFKALVRPITEYGNPVWCPHKRGEINLIEDVQRHFTRCIEDMKDKNYYERLKSLNLPSLEFRRVRGDLIEMYKICNKIYDPKTTNTLTNFVPDENPTRAHKFKLTKKRTNLKNTKYFYTNRIVNIWNSLPAEAVDAISLNHFKNIIDHLLKDYKFSVSIDIFSPLKFHPLKHKNLNESMEVP